MMNTLISDIGFSNVSLINVSDIEFEPSLLELCKMNACGNYCKNYTCPPLIGNPPELIKHAKSYNRAIVFQKIYQLTDSFDIEGMDNSRIDFRNLTHKVNDLCKNRLDDYLLLTAGGCSECSICGAVTGEKCSFPQKAYPSLEAYSINVSTLCEKSGMKYINGVNTVTYFGAIFIK